MEVVELERIIMAYLHFDLIMEVVELKIVIMDYKSKLFSGQTETSIKGRREN